MIPTDNLITHLAPWPVSALLSLDLADCAFDTLLACTWLVKRFWWLLLLALAAVTFCLPEATFQGMVGGKP